MQGASCPVPILSQAVKRTRAQTPRGAAEQIETFLRSDPAAPLTAAVGFASVRGLAWLAERTAGRTVTLLIGDCRPGNFAKASPADRSIVRAFLARSDVEVKNLYRKNPKQADAHLKVWIAHTKEGPRALVGSANLTGAGLFRNWEMVTEPAPSDLPRVVDAVDALVGQAWDVEARLGKYIHPNGQHIRPQPNSTPPAKGHSPEGRRRHRTESRPKEPWQPAPAGRDRSPTSPVPRAAQGGCLQLLGMLVFLPVLWLALLSRLWLLLIGAGALLTAADVISVQAITGQS